MEVNEDSQVEQSVNLGGMRTKKQREARNYKSDLPAVQSYCFFGIGFKFGKPRCRAAYKQI